MTDGDEGKGPVQVSYCDVLLVVGMDCGWVRLQELIVGSMTT